MARRQITGAHDENARCEPLSLEWKLKWEVMQRAFGRQLE